MQSLLAFAPKIIAYQTNTAQKIRLAHNQAKRQDFTTKRFECAFFYKHHLHPLLLSNINLPQFCYYFISLVDILVIQRGLSDDLHYRGEEFVAHCMLQIKALEEFIE